MREAMAEDMKGRVVGGEGKTVEIDGGYFGGYVKPANRKEDRLDRRLAENQSGKLCASAAAIRFLPFSIRKAQPLRSFGLALPRAARFTPMRLLLGMDCMIASK
jgi:hypothetical protein